MSTPKFIFLQLPQDASVASGTDWAMWSAIATAAATAVALFVPIYLHFRAEKRRELEHARIVDRRTRDVGPQLAGDVMRAQWSLVIMMSAFRRAAVWPSHQRHDALREDFQKGKLQIEVAPGSDVFPGDIDLLADPVREHLAAFKAQVAVLNSMTKRVVVGPTEPHENREAAIKMELYQLAYQLVATSNRGVTLMLAMEPFLDPELNELNKSFRSTTDAHLRTLRTIAEVRNAELPGHRVPLPVVEGDLVAAAPHGSATT